MLDVIVQCVFLRDFFSLSLSFFLSLRHYVCFVYKLFNLKFKKIEYELSDRQHITQQLFFGCGQLFGEFDIECN